MSSTALTETAYLLRSKNNRRHLMKSLREEKNGETIVFDAVRDNKHEGVPVKKSIDLLKTIHRKKI
jgi:hypothetical protein